MAESRLQRWSRKKAGVSKEPEHSALSTVESGPSPEEQELAINEALPEQEVLEKYQLPDPDAIELGTDITGFMRNEIPELLRRRALRSLWKSNPVLAVLDGLNDYDEDFSNAATTVEGVKTLYKVGQGMFDKAARVVEQAENQVQEQVDAPEPIAPNAIAEKSEPEIAIEPHTTRQLDPVATQAEVASAPRYRPRMRFDR